MSLGRSTTETLTVEVTPALIKTNSSKVKELIEKYLGKGVKNTHCYDIQATAVGFLNGYATVRGLSLKDKYTIESDLGSNDQQFLVSKEVGFFESTVCGERTAYEAAKMLVNSCDGLMGWDLIKNGERLCTLFPAKFNNGLTLSVTVTGNTYEDLIDAASVLGGVLEDGSDNGDLDYSDYKMNYHVYGTEVNTLSEPVLNCRAEYGDYAIMTEHGIIDEAHTFNALTGPFSVTLGGLTEEEGFLKCEWSKYIAIGQIIHDSESLNSGDSFIFYNKDNGTSDLIKYQKQTISEMLLFGCDLLESNNISIFKVIEVVYKQEVAGFSSSISDDDICSYCKNCIYCPGGDSYCKMSKHGDFGVNFPCLKDEDDYAISCQYLSK